MQIVERVMNDVVILDLSGKMTLGEGDEKLKNKIHDLITRSETMVILNMADVPYIDSSGLMEISRSYTTLARYGGLLKLLNIGQRVKNLLAITKLDRVFEIFDNEEKAVRSFEQVVP